MQKKSQELKELQNTDRSDREVAPAKKFEGKVPTPVIKLSTKSRKWYDTICKELIDVDGFIAPDAITVAQFCKALDLYISVCKELNNADDCIQRFANGTNNVSGYFTVYQKLSNQLKDLAPQIGIGVKARQNVTQFLNNQLTLNFGEDPWSDIRKTIPV